MTRCLALALLCAPAAAPAQATAPVAPPAAPSLTDEQLANIARQLDQIETQITKGRGDVLGTAMTKFRAAMAGQKEALALYLECYKLTHFDRKDLKQTEFQTWKDRNDGRLKDEDFQTGLRLQLEYLVLSLQAQDVREGKDMAPVVAALQSFVPKAVAALQGSLKHTASGAVEEKDKGGGRPGGRPGGGRPDGDGRPGGGDRRPGADNAPAGDRPPASFEGGGELGSMMRESVESTEFSNAFHLDDHMQRKNWAYAPLDIAGMYDLVIFPYYLDQKPGELAAQWDARINAELTLRRIAHSESEFAAIARERHPELLWQKASYLFEKKVNPIQALADMLKVVRDNPAHPQARTWLAQVRASVNSAKSAPTPLPPPAPVPAGN